MGVMGIREKAVPLGIPAAQKKDQHASLSHLG
jgi:hypothetical protein